MLSETAISHYEREGYHFPIDILSAAEAARCRRNLEEHENRTGAPLKSNMRHKSHLLFTWLNELIRHPRILDAVESVLGPNLLCWSSSFFIKEPNDPGFVSWHQDATYWGLSSPEVTTVWLALTPANLVNGCMAFIPGTHHVEVAHRDTFDRHNLLTRGQEIAVAVDQSKAVHVELWPGQASLHHVMLVHGSAPNRGDDRRIGYAIRYIPTHVRQIVGERDSATLVRGIDAYHHFDAEPAPVADLSDEAIALHAAITARQAGVLYRGTGRGQFRD